MIPYGRQNINQADIDAVIEVLRSDFLTQGPAVPAFEARVAGFCGVQNAIALNSATSALHLACQVLGVNKGDVVWTSPITFVASANCALYCGATVDFVDINPLTYNMDIECLANKLAEAEKLGCLPKVVIPVHMCGQSCDMAEISRLSLKYNFRIIEDASHAIGGMYRGELIGNCRYSDITIFSFHPVKIITTGEGGMATTNDIRLAKKMELLRSHGITRNISEMTCAPDGPWYYQQQVLGYNYRMDDLRAALGLSQMSRLSEFVTARHGLANRYARILADLPVQLPWQHPDVYSGFHLYVIRLRLVEITKTRRQVFESLRSAGIGVNVHYIPVYRQPYYENLGYKPGHCPEAERYYREILTLPLYPGLSEIDQDEVASVLSQSIAE